MTQESQTRGSSLVGNSKSPKSLRAIQKRQQIFVAVLLAILCIVWTLPTMGVLVTSFRPRDEVTRTGWWTAWKDIDAITLENYQQVLGGKPFTYINDNGVTVTERSDNMVNAFLNSITVTIPSVIIPILIAAFAAYGFAWLSFPGRRILFAAIVAILVVPLQIALIPILRDYQKLHLNGTYLGLWLAHAGFGLPLATYMLFNYISTSPKSIMESAFIDG